MAIASVNVGGGNSNKTSGTTLAFSPSNNNLVSGSGSVGVFFFTADNLSATTPTATVTDSAGNTWTTIVQKGQNATAAAGLVAGIAVAPITSSLTTASTVTVTFSGAIVAKAAALWGFSGCSTTLRNAVVSASASSTAATVTSGSATSGDLVIGVIASESSTNPPADTDTTNGTWSSASWSTNALGGASATHVSMAYHSKITTGTGTQTMNATVTNSDWVCAIAVLQPEAVGGGLTKFRVNQSGASVNYFNAGTRASRW